MTRVLEIVKPRVLIVCVVIVDGGDSLPDIDV